MKNSIRKNINKYYFFQFFNSLAFFVPVIVVFWQSHGLNMTQIMTLQSIYAIGVVLLELPTGVVADKLGKRISLICGALFFSVGLLLYGISTEFWQFALFELTVGAGMAFISGADSAFLHQSLKSIGRENDYRKIEGRVRGQNQIAQAVGNILGGVVASVSLGFTLIATGISTFISFVISLSFSETKVKLPREEKTQYGQVIKDSLQIIRKNSEILWLTGFFAVFNSLVWTTNWYSQPYLSMLEVPIVFYGAIFAGFSLVAGIGSSLTDKFAQVFHGRQYLFLGIFTVVIMLMLSIFPSIYIFPLYSLFKTFALMNKTLVSNEVLQCVPPERAATILSFQNLVRRLVYAVAGPLLGLVVDTYSLTTGILVNGVLLALSLVVLFLFKPNNTAQQTS